MKIIKIMCCELLKKNNVKGRIKKISLRLKLLVRWFFKGKFKDRERTREVTSKCYVFCSSLKLQVVEKI